MTFFYFFFFSSRRRHTRWTGDWSSDVCSSDLEGETAKVLREPRRHDAHAAVDELGDHLDDAVVEELHLVDADRFVAGDEPTHLETGGSRHGAHLRAAVRDDVPDVEAVVDGGLDDQRPQAGDLRAPDA